MLLGGYLRSTSLYSALICSLMWLQWLRSIREGKVQITSKRILQARILEWVAISFSRDLPDPGIEPGSPGLQADW